MTYTLLVDQEEYGQWQVAVVFILLSRAFFGGGAGKRLSLELRLYIREGDVVCPQNEYPVFNLYTISSTFVYSSQVLPVVGVITR